MTGADSPTPASGMIVVRPLLTAGEVARVLSIGERTVWRMVSRSRAGSGSFPKPIRIGGKIARWRWRDVEEYLQESVKKPVDVSAGQR